MVRGITFTFGGSSPLARGLLSSVAGVVIDDRIIPARAGFTSSTRRRRTGASDHPRSRGVYIAIATRWHEDDGSSPLARGLPSQLPSQVSFLRIIPARAGFTWAGTWVTRSSADHPRSRGVYPAPASLRILLRGSSPLARGLRSTREAHRVRLRIIPARAGFTTARARLRSKAADHPRSRGVY